MNFKILPVAFLGAVLPLSTVHAQSTSPIDLDVKGYMRAYFTHNTQDTAPGQSERNVDIIRDTEIHIKGEGALDNGTKIGATIEITADRGDGAIDKSFLYAQDNWGRVEMGSNNGVAYLLQVDAPAADSNYDGSRQYVRAVNYALAPAVFTALAGHDLEYAHDTSASTDKINYLTPVFGGFQAGISYTPDTQASGFTGHQESTALSRGLNGVNTDDEAGAYGSAWDIAARYETKINEWELVAGAGYVHIDLEKSAAGEDDLNSWNAAMALNYQGFGAGISYTENDNGRRTDTDTEILVVGVDYKTGPWKLGASWYGRTDENFAGGAALDTDRFSLGAGYTYGPGMSLRGSWHYIDHEVGNADMDATTLLLGTQVTF